MAAERFPTGLQELQLLEKTWSDVGGAGMRRGAQWGHNERSIRDVGKAMAKTNSSDGVNADG